MFVIDSRNSLKSQLSPESHLLVLGPPRCGKTKNVVIPNVIASQCATIVTSTKPDIFTATASVRKAHGQVWVFDPFGTVSQSLLDSQGAKKLNYSPLQDVTDFRNCILLARSMVRSASQMSAERGSFWQERAEATLAPVFLAAKIAGWTMDNVMELIESKEVEPAYAHLVGSGQVEAARTLSSVIASAEKERSGILSNAAGILGAYRTPQVIEQSKSPNFSADLFVGGKDTLYVIAPASDQEVLAPLIVGLLWSIKDSAYKNATKQTLDSGYLSPVPQVKFILDEMANVAPIHDLTSLLSEGASQGVLVLGVLQDLSQARARWPGASDGMITLFGNAMLFPGVSDLRTLDDFSKLSGEKLTMVPSRGAPDSLFGQHRRSLGGQIRPRLSIAALNRLSPNQALFYSGTRGFSRVEFDTNPNLEHAKSTENQANLEHLSTELKPSLETDKIQNDLEVSFLGQYSPKKSRESSFVARIRNFASNPLRREI